MYLEARMPPGTAAGRTVGPGSTCKPMSTGAAPFIGRSTGAGTAPVAHHPNPTSQPDLTIYWVRNASNNRGPNSATSSRDAL
jgi:hypothetical protein